jgi:PleD family two-component response regulator
VSQLIEKEKVNEFIKRTDKLMYQAKKTGKNKACSSDETDLKKESE